MRALALCLAVFLLGSDEPPPPPPTGKKRVPESKAGKDVVGKTLPIQNLVWLNTDQEKPPALDGKVTLVRWWTESCPYCETSLPAIQALQKKYGEERFQTLAVYHAKPPRAVRRGNVLDCTSLQHQRPSSHLTHRLLVILASACCCPFIQVHRPHHQKFLCSACSIF